MLQDVHVIRFYGQRTEGKKQYLFLECAAGGELFDRIGIYIYCAVPENIHTPPTERIGVSWGVGGFCKAKKFKEMYEAYWNFQRVGRILEKTPSVGEVWIFSGFTH